MNLKEIQHWYSLLYKEYSFSDSFNREFKNQLGSELIKRTGLEDSRHSVCLFPVTDPSTIVTKIASNSMYVESEYFSIEYKDNISFLKANITSVDEDMNSVDNDDHDHTCIIAWSFQNEDGTFRKFDINSKVNMCSIDYNEPNINCIIAWTFQNEDGTFIEFDPKQEVPKNGILKLWFEQFPQNLFKIYSWEIQPPFSFKLEDLRKNLHWWNSENLELVIITKNKYGITTINDILDGLEECIESWYSKVEELDEKPSNFKELAELAFNKLDNKETITDETLNELKSIDDFLALIIPDINDQRVNLIGNNKFVLYLRIPDDINILDLILIYFLSSLEKILEIDKVIINPGYEHYKIFSQRFELFRTVERKDIAESLNDPWWDFFHQEYFYFYIIVKSKKKIDKDEIRSIENEWNKNNKNHIQLSIYDFEDYQYYRLELDENEALISTSLYKMPKTNAKNFYEFLCSKLKLESFSVIGRISI